MPKVVRQVEAEASHEELIEELQKYVDETPPIGVRLGDLGSKDGEEIVVGDVLIPKPEAYTVAPIVLDTYVLVTSVIPRAGVLLGVILTRDGNKGYSFFQGHQFEGKYKPVAKKLQRPKK
jgi:hypothetical protein